MANRRRTWPSRASCSIMFWRAVSRATSFTFSTPDRTCSAIEWRCCPRSSTSNSIRLLLRNRKLAVLLLGGMVLHTFITITYRAPQTVEYMLPAYVLLVIMLGYGLGEFRIQNAESRILSSIFWILNSLALLSVILLFISHFPSFSWLHQHDDTRAYAESLLNDAPPNAIILSNWHWANPMWYLQQVEGLRLDVQVNYVYPRGSEPLATSWLKDIETGLTLKRPVIVDMFFPAAFHATLPYR